MSWPAAGRVSAAGVGRVPLVPHQRQHRAAEGAAGGPRRLRRTAPAHDELLPHLGQHLQNAAGVAAQGGRPIPAGQNSFLKQENELNKTFRKEKKSFTSILSCTLGKCPLLFYIYTSLVDFYVFLTVAATDVR